MNPKDIVGARKAPLEGVPAAGAIFAAPAHAIGHAKYGPFNWRDQPVQVMSYIGAIQRHLAAYVDGQDLAEDTQVHHLAHALAGLNIIADSMALGTLIDNRPMPGPAADMLRAQDRSTVTTDAILEALDVIFTEADRVEGAVNAAEAAHHWADRVMHQGALITREEWGAGDGAAFEFPDMRMPHHP